MEKILEKLFDLKKIPTKFISVIWVTTSILLFAPLSWLTKLYIVQFNTEYGKYLGIIFILSTGFLVISIVSYFIKILNRKKFESRMEAKIDKAVEQLDFHEKALLREFFIQGKNTLQLPIDNDTISGLSNKGIIYQVSNYGFTYYHGAYWAYSITEYAKGLLTPSMLGLTQNPTEEEKMTIFNNRPQWAIEK